MKKLHIALFLLLSLVTMQTMAQTPNCNAQFSFQISGTTVFFTPVMPASNTTSHLWSFGDQTTSTQANPSHTYTNCGTYSVLHYVSVTDSTGGLLCSDTLVMTITITQCNTTCNLQANFQFGALPTPPNTFVFTNTSVGFAAGDSIRWTFGDGSAASYDLSPTHTFPAPGAFTVCLRIKRQTQPGTPPCVSELCRQVIVAPSCNLLPGFVTFPSQTNPNQIIFVNNSPGSANTIATWNFGDGTSATGNSVTHTYAQGGQYSVCMLIRSAFDTACTATTCDTVVVNANTCNLQANFTSGSLPAPAYTQHFTNTSIGFAAGDSIRWTFGDGSAPSFDLSPTHSFPGPGSYTVCLWIKRQTQPGTAPCVSELCRQVVVAPSCNLIPAFSAIPGQTNPNQIIFINNSSGSANTIATWNFGDGTSATGNTVTHTYSQGGEYIVCMFIRSTFDSACTATTCDTVSVNAPTCNLLPSYTYQAADSLHPNTLVFTNTTVGTTPNSVVTWTFGDGTSGSGNTVTHTFTQTGPFNVCLHVASSNTCSADTCGPVTVTIPNSCNLQASFVFTPIPNQVNSIQFTNTSIGFAAGDSIRWTFGDGTPASFDVNPVHTFAAPGNYQVCLRVKKASTPGTAPCVREFCLLMIIPGTAPCNITPSFTVQPIPNTPNGFVFTNTSITANAPLVTWNFGDSTTATGNTVTHLFSQPGTYQVCMTVSYPNSNCVRDTCISLTVTNTTPPACNISANFTYQTSPNNPTNTAYFLSNINGLAAGDSIRWTFGDGTSVSYILNPVHTYLVPGTYTVCLRIKRNTAPGTPPCVVEVCQQVTVTGPGPIICDSVRVRYSFVRDHYMPNKLYFFSISNFRVMQQSWTITPLNNAGNTVTLNQFNPAWVFTQPGNYRVCLRAVTIGNCVKEYCDTISISNVVQGCQLLAYPNPATTQVTVNAVLNTAAPIYAYLYNSQNILLQRIARGGVSGSNAITFNINSLPAGNYTIRVYYNGQVCVARFQKL